MGFKETREGLAYKRTGKDMLFLQVVFFAALMVLLILSDIKEYQHITIVSVSMDIVMIPVLFIMMLSCLRSTLIDKTVFSFMIIIFSVTAFCLLDAVMVIIENIGRFGKINLYANTLYYILVVFMSWTFWRFLYSWHSDKTKQTAKISKVVGVITAVAIVLGVLNVFYGFYFSVSDAGKRVQSKEYFVCLIIPILIHVICIIYTLKQKIPFYEKAIFVSYPLLPVIAAIFKATYDITIVLTVSVFLSTLFIYSNIFVRKDESLARRQSELAESNMNTMMLQINPHFIYNTLGSISSLCREDPDKAEKLLHSFSNYLRNNFSEMAKKTLIPIEEELEHLQFYVSIEKLRFPDINVVFDLKASSFNIPSLTVQPLVENAIKHGILGREEGGTLKISTYEEDNYYCVCVEDDGVGFETLEKHDGRNHIGVANVRKRLEMLCGGVLSINSTVNIGTVAVIKIPK